MIIGVLLFLTANAAIFLGAHEILRSCRIGHSSVDPLIFLLLRLLLISAVVVIAGLTSTLTVWGLGIAGGAALVGLVASGAHKRLGRPALPKVDRWMQILALAVFVRLLLQVWVFAPHLGDALAYHLPKIAEWVQNGRFTREMGVHPHATFPAGFELIETWWVVFLHHDVLIEMAGVEFLVLALSAVYALGSLLGLGSRGSFLAALVYILTPGFHLSTTSCLNDAPVASLELATMALVFARAPLSLVFLAAGLGLGIKPTYAYSLPGMVLLGILVRRGPPSAYGPRWKSWGLIIPALTLGLFWYLRNAIWFGNPVFPVGEPSYATQSIAVQLGPRWSSLRESLRDLVDYRIYDLHTALGANVDHMSGWGPVIMSTGLAGLIPTVIQIPRLAKLAAAFGVSLLSTLLLSVYDPWCLKYVYFFPALGALALVPLADEHRGVRSVAIAGLCFAFLATFVPYDLPSGSLRELWRQDWRVRSTLEEPELARQAPIVACFGGHQIPSAWLYHPDYSRRVVYVRADELENFVHGLHESTAPVLFSIPATKRQIDLLAECIQRGLLESLGNHFYRILRP